LVEKIRGKRGAGQRIAMPQMKDAADEAEDRTEFGIAAATKADDLSMNTRQRSRTTRAARRW
jgi:hypothetical protein